MSLFESIYDIWKNWWNKPVYLIIDIIDLVSK